MSEGSSDRNSRKSTITFEGSEDAEAEASCRPPALRELVVVDAAADAAASGFKSAVRMLWRRESASTTKDDFSLMRYSKASFSLRREVRYCRMGEGNNFENFRCELTLLFFR